MRASFWHSQRGYAVVFLILNALQMVHAQLQWTSAAPTLTGAAYGNGMYVVVGDGGLIWTSENLSDWKRQTSPVPTLLSAVAFGKGAFVAVGTGLILRSTNGVEWSQQIVPEEIMGGELNNVKFLNNQFVAVGGYVNVNTSYGWILTSPDGIRWEVPFSKPPIGVGVFGPALFGVSFGDGTYAAVGGGQQNRPPYSTFSDVLESPDGSTWTQLSNVPGAILAEAAFGDGRFVAVGPGGTLMRREGSWESTSGAAARSVVYSQNEFIAVGDGGLIQTSVDGLTWTNQPSGTAARLMRIVQAQENLLAVGDSGTILHSTDGKAWKTLFTSYIPFGNGSIGGLAYGNGQFVATHFNGVLRSEYGLVWTGNQVASNGVYLGSSTFGAGKFVIAASTIVSPKATLFTSSNATDWNQPALPTTIPLTTVAFANNLFLAGGAGVIMTSSDGATWTIRNEERPWNLAWMGFAYGNDRFLAMSDKGTVATSWDGVIWQMHDTPVVIGEGALTFGKGVFVVAAGGLIWASEDGLSWQVRFPVANPYLLMVAYMNDVFVASGLSGIVTSLDATTWTLRPATFRLKDFWNGPVRLAFGNATFVRLCAATLGGSCEIHTSPAEAFLEAARFRTDGSFEMNVSAGTLDVFRVDATENLRNWSTILTLPKSAAAAPVQDSGAPQFPNRFYRLASPTP